MSIEPYDTPLRWLVASDSRPEEHHLVDLGITPLGECTCEDFVCRKRRCKHLRFARDYLVDLVIARLRELPNPNPSGASATDPNGEESYQRVHSV